LKVAREAISNLLYSWHMYVKGAEITPREMDYRHVKAAEEVLKQIVKAGGGQNAI